MICIYKCNTIIIPVNQKLKLLNCNQIILLLLSPHTATQVNTRGRFSCVIFLFPSGYLLYKFFSIDEVIKIFSTAKIEEAIPKNLNEVLRVNISPIFPMRGNMNIMKKLNTIL